MTRSSPRILALFLAAAVLPNVRALSLSKDEKSEGSAFSVKVSPAGSTVAVTKGAVKARNGKGEVEVRAGSQTTMRRGKGPSVPVPADAQREISWALEGPLAQRILKEGLVGHWRFDEGQGNTARDSSPYHHNGEVKGAVWTSGVQGGALRFDGSEAHVHIGDPPALELTGSLSLCAWIKVDRYSTNGRIVCKQNGPGRRGWSMNVEEWKIVRMQIPWDADKTVAVDSPPTPANQWMHVVTVYDAPKKVMSLYLNGSLVTTHTDDLPDRMFNSDLEVRIGGRHGGGCYFAGTIDEVRIYSRPLDEAEVKTLYRLSGGSGVE